MKLLRLLSGFDAFLKIVDIHIRCDEMQQIPYVRLMPFIQGVPLVHIDRDVQRQT